MRKDLDMNRLVDVFKLTDASTGDVGFYGFGDMLDLLEDDDGAYSAFMEMVGTWKPDTQFNYYFTHNGMKYNIQGLKYDPETESPEQFSGFESYRKSVKSVKVKKTVSGIKKAENVFTQEDLDEINRIMREDGQYVEFYPESGIGLVVRFQSEVIDGDWKHTHLRIDWLIEEYLEQKGIPSMNIDHDYVEDTGCDWGPAYHYFVVLTDGSFKV